MEDELLAVIDDGLADVLPDLFVLLGVDTWDVRPPKLEELLAESHVHTRRLDLEFGIVQRLDNEVAVIEPGTDIAVRKDHANTPDPEGLKDTRSPFGAWLQSPPQGGTSKRPGLFNRRMKQAIVVRSDLGMGTGKLAAQVAHAALSAVEHANSDTVRDWKRDGQRKVVLKIDGERALFEIQEKAKTAGLPTGLIRDAGRTQLDPDTPTTVAVGPASDDAVDQITGSLSLY
jgi:PTH2 family peptidyl-tRNA hydrolase